MAWYERCVPTSTAVHHFWYGRVSFQAAVPACTARRARPLVAVPGGSLQRVAEIFISYWFSKGFLKFPLGELGNRGVLLVLRHARPLLTASFTARLQVPLRGT